MGMSGTLLQTLYWKGMVAPFAMEIKKKTHEEYVAELAIKNPNIDVIGKYVNAKTKILHRCKIDGYEWMAKPNNMLSGMHCPVCVHRKISDPPKYINSIWASEFKDYFSKFMTDQQMKSYMPKSGQKIDCICPDCGRHKLQSPSELLKHGLGCTCGDGISYPNKFIYSLLYQLNVDFIHEYSPKWANKKAYDIYIPSLNCIIENHGMQHYENVGFSLDVEATQDNDAYKERIARENGVEYYIVIDCRKSDGIWIKNSVLNSKLTDIAGFSEEDVDWTECDRFATSNMVKSVSCLWNDGLSIGQIVKRTGLCQSTVLSYLKKGRKFEWCDYNKEESTRRRNLSRLD